MRRKILVVDDSEILVAWLHHQLGAVGYDVVSATRPTDAALLVASERPSVIIVDLIMPQTEAGEVIRHIRVADPGHSIPIILYSGQPPRRLQETAALHGASGWVTKKRDITDLLVCVERCVRGERVQITVPTATPPRAEAGNRKRCLFVDDDATVLRGYQRSFGERMNADFVCSPIAALGRLHAADAPSFVVTDIVMPVMSGLDLYAKAVNLNERWRDRFVFVTGSDRWQTLGDARVPVLPKPVSIERLQALIAVAI